MRTSPAVSLHRMNPIKILALLALSLAIRHPERVTRKQATELVCGYGRGDGYDAANEAMRAR